MLAASYVALHDTWSEGMAKLLLDAQCAGTPPAILAALAQMDDQLRDRIRQLEQAMLRLGMVVIRPQKDEGFNVAYHQPVGTSTGAVGAAQIAKCIRPGVMLQGAMDALVKAEVELQ